jgi:hypothetical protein
LAGPRQRRNPFEVTIRFVPVSALPDRLEADWAKDCDKIILRRCPVCEQESIIGHGRRRKQAHDEHHDWISVRRGRCEPGSRRQSPRVCHGGFPFLGAFAEVGTFEPWSKFYPAPGARQAPPARLRKYPDVLSTVAMERDEVPPNRVTFRVRAPAVLVASSTNQRLGHRLRYEGILS